MPDAIAVPASAPLVVTEGNYLLLDEPPWSAVRELLDEVWFVEVAEPVRVQRLIARHVEFGRTADDATRPGRPPAATRRTRAWSRRRGSAPTSWSTRDHHGFRQAG